MRTAPSFVFAVALAAEQPALGILTIQNTEPRANAIAAPFDTAITVNFNQPVDPASVTAASVRVFGRWSGPAEGAFSFINAGQTLVFTPANPFSAGETVTVYLSHDLESNDGQPLRDAGYTFRFWTATRRACWVFDEIDVMSNYSDPPAQTRIYGAVGADLDNDGWLDLTTVNEVSADLRVFLNRADGTGLFDPWLEPPEAGLPEMSPNDTADFNNDGNTDLCVAATDADSILVFLGDGNGTCQSATVIPVGVQPHGITVLDADGDGDIDIVNGNWAGNNLSLHLNAGNGTFAPPISLEGGVNGEYGLASGDMNNDGIMDIVVGGNTDHTVGVLRGDGNATFTLIGSAPCGGPVWQVGTGDVNGDGREDAHTCNSFAATGGILLNQGAGVLAPAVTYPAGGHAPATDLGDFDGDGDLDWLLSAFGGGLWRLFENDGQGAFTESQDFAAPANPSCGIAMDLDNDRRLDVVLTDEIADLVILMRSVAADGDTDCDGAVTITDLLEVLGTWGACPDPCPPGCPADVNGDCDVDVSDLLSVLAAWSS